MVARPVDDVAILVERRLIRDWPAVVEFESGPSGRAHIDIGLVRVRGKGRGR